jgi:vacuolar-type H+-ATPase subunit I/STV1
MKAQKGEFDTEFPIRADCPTDSGALDNLRDRVTEDDSLIKQTSNQLAKVFPGITLPSSVDYILNSVLFHEAEVPPRKSFAPHFTTQPCNWVIASIYILAQSHDNLTLNQTSRK